MKDKIKDLIQHHKNACDELNHLINELHSLEGVRWDVQSEKYNKISKYGDELAWRKLFIQDLEDTL